MNNTAKNETDYSVLSSDGLETMTSSDLVDLYLIHALGNVEEALQHAESYPAAARQYIEAALAALTDARTAAASYYDYCDARVDDDR